MIKMNFKISGFMFFVLSVIVLITISSTSFILKQNEEKKQIIFLNTANKIPSLIENRLKVYDQVLLSSRALFYSSNDVTRKEWKSFVDEMHINKNYPGIQGIGFSKVIKPEDLSIFVDEMRNQGFENFDIKPKGKREIYTSIIYLEPFDDRNKRAFGYDMFSQETRRLAMQNAINTGNYSLSGKVHLLQENGNDVQAGFLAYIPVYKSNMPLTTYKEKLDATLGFVYAPFRVKDLITSIDIDENMLLDIAIYDNGVENNENLLFDFSNHEHSMVNQNYDYKKIITVGGRQWLIKVNPYEGFFKDNETKTHYIVLTFGLTLIIVALTLNQIYNFYENKKKVYIDDIKALALRKDLALKAATIGTWEWTFKDNSLKWDKNMYHIYGIDMDIKNKELLSAWKNLIYKEYKNKVFNEVFKAKNKKESLDIKYWTNTKRNEKKYIHTIGTLEYNNLNKPIRMIGINHDITDYEINKLELLQQKELLNDQKKKFETMIKLSKDAIAITDLDTNFLFVNEAYSKMTGFSNEELLKTSSLKMTLEDDKERFEAILDDVIKNGYIENFEKVSISKKGNKIFTNMTIVLLPDKQRFLITARDYSELKRKEKIIQEYVSVIDKNVITSSTDLKGFITDVSEAFCKISGYEKEELIGVNHNIIRHPSTPKELYEYMWSKLVKNEIWKGEIKNIAKDGTFYWVDATISPRYDEHGYKIGYTAVRQDITNKKLIERISITDGLTNLYNRRHFDDIFPKFIQSAKRHNEIVCFALMDVDHFKQYNDTYGHQMGDEVLITIGKVLRDSLNRSDDYCFRLGGEEFGVLFKAENINNALEFVNKIRFNIEDEEIPHEKNSASQYVTASFGLICLNANNIEDSDSVYKNVDELLYKAKEEGRNRVVCNC